MEKKDYIEWIIRWFRENTDFSDNDLENNFFNNGLLNSFKTLQLLIDIESSLKIPLPDSAFSNLEFSTINGLASILFSLKNPEES